MKIHAVESEKPELLKQTSHRVFYQKPFFRGTPEILGPEKRFPGFDTEALTRIQKHLTPCVYGRNIAAFLKPENNFEAKRADRLRIACRNFFYPDEKDLYRGTCGELAHRVGEQLKADPVLGEKYEFIYAIGSEPKYFPMLKAHTYLLAWPRDLQSCSPSGKPLPTREALKYTYSDNRFPPGVVIIDPSFNVIGVPGRDEAVAGYQVNTVMELEDIEIQPKTHDMWINMDGSTAPSILGFVKDFIPSRSLGESDDRLLHFQVRFSVNGPAICRLLSQRPGEKPVPADALLEGLPEDHLVKRFFTLLENQLNQEGS